MYASAARNLHVAGSPQDKLTVLDNLKQKLKTKRPLAIGNLILVDQSQPLVTSSSWIRA